MSRKYWGYRSIDLPGGIRAEVQGQDTSYGFRHLCSLYRGDAEIAAAKCTYYNRTWEAWEFQSVVRAAIEKIGKKNITDEERAELLAWVDQPQEDRHSGMLKSIAMVAKMGELLATKPGVSDADNQKAANDWKARMLKAGLENQGLEMPEDWDQLTEDEKQRRLDGAIGTLSE